MVSYFPFDFNHIRREVHPCRTAIDVRRRFCSFLQAAFLKQLDAHVFSYFLASLKSRAPMARDRISLSRASPPLAFEALRKHSTAYRR